MNEAVRKRRLFVGIELDDAARGACAAVADRLCRTGYAAKYELPEKLHITLAFLGYVEPVRVGDVAAAMREIAKGAPRLDVTLDKLGAFPHERKPRVVYVGAREQGAAFRGLASEVRSRYEALGFEFRNDAVAHVTIARVKPPQRPLPLLEMVPIPLVVERLALFESVPDRARATSRYVTLESAPLRDAA
ncbi:MAG: RNA 2',3'-cyclic phosphodiesterase [Candidatus Eremiobacteraeota bacterium]|nr:RNA 2',3'-cyclic phosphodiesterase [Candidatus Eremiobacteraeota bacterium]